MEDNHNLEKFFRQKFNQKIEPEDWNIPDNDIWDKIALEIPSEKRKKNKIVFLPILLCIGLLGLSLIFLRDNHQKDQKIAQLEKTLKECSQPSNGIQSNPSHVSSMISVTPSDVNISMTLPTKAYNITSPKTSGFNKNLPGTSRETDANLDPTFPTYDQEQNKVALLKNDATQSTWAYTEPKELIHLPPLIKLTTPPSIQHNRLDVIHSLNHKKSLLIDREPTFIQPKKEPKANWWLGANTGFIFWKDREIGTFDNPLSELLVSEETAHSWLYCIQVNKNVGRNWMVIACIQYYTRNQKSIYAINLPYSTTQEIAVGSDYENRFEHSLPTGLGNISTSLVLARSNDSPVSDNENVLLDFSIKNELRAFAVPLTFSYFPKEAGNGFFIQGGLNNEFVFQNKIIETASASHHIYVKDKSVKVDYNASQINKINIGAIAGLGYQKTFSKGIGIAISANYGLALNNTFSTANYQHKIDQINMQFSVMKSWR